MLDSLQQQRCYVAKIDPSYSGYCGDNCILQDGINLKWMCWYSVNHSARKMAPLTEEWMCNKSHRN